MLTEYIRLGAETLVPVIATVLFYRLEQNTRFGRLKFAARQIIIGLVFGLIAVMGTEFGIPLNGAIVNCRDAAPLCAGLFFGGPAGIIAGCIGGIERWMCVYWGGGTFTRLACSLATVIAGLYAAFLRKFIFEEKRPGWGFALASGIVIEVIHLTLVFITNVNDPVRAAEVVKAASAPMVAANGLAVFASALLLSWISKKHEMRSSDGLPRISDTIQKWLLCCVVLAFLVTTGFMYFLEERLCENDTEELLALTIEDVKMEVEDTSDARLLDITFRIAEELPKSFIKGLRYNYAVSEISVINSDGIIEKSTNEDYVGFDMKSGAQSAEFMELLSGREYIVQKYGPITRDSSVWMKYAGVPYKGGILQVGYNADGFQHHLREQIVDITSNRHVGKQGFVVIMDESGKIVSGPKDMKGADRLPSLVEDGLIGHGTGTVFEMRFENTEYFCVADKAEGYCIASMIPVDEAYQNSDVVSYVNGYLQVIIFSAMFGMIYLLVSRTVVKSIRRVNEALLHITEGRLDTVVDVNTSHEFASLSRGINSTVDKLKEYIKEANSRIDKDLDTARSIQQNSLPSIFPAYPGRTDFDVYAFMEPAREVGGDFYDFYTGSAETFNFMIADVSGKGIPAAMFMMRAKAQLKSLSETGLEVNDVFTKGNDNLVNDDGLFVTAWLGRIDLSTGAVSFTNAGHNPPLLKKAGGSYEFLRSKPGLVLAGMEGMRYRSGSIMMEPGDTLFLYTDGVTEATDSKGCMFGEERLKACLDAYAGSSLEELCKRLKAEIDRFAGEAPQFDDITMLAFRFQGKGEAALKESI